ncbi:TetR/AcrR family transcriptional regulator [Micromonospora sp. CB01531]|uniref:TetR/AcrR family transcriptional regulator n=1 Tax=Micromonospora sp. CB01531 TaxID=1718947 RepID=UPI000A71E64D|nr:TetR/AcrR family transcriptional regulator [Micromonospora sp. CB01531]
MQVFWERGYEGASLTDLTTAMGIASPSLYAAFGNKEALFREAVAHYNATHGAVPQRPLPAPGSQYGGNVIAPDPAGSRPTSATPVAG